MKIVSLVEKVEIEGVGLRPRRQSVPHLTHEELMIARAMDAVERLGASVELTDCINSLYRAKEALADHVEKSRLYAEVAS